MAGKTARRRRERPRRAACGHGTFTCDCYGPHRRCRAAIAAAEEVATPGYPSPRIWTRTPDCPRARFPLCLQHSRPAPASTSPHLADCSTRPRSFVVRRSAATGVPCPIAMLHRSPWAPMPCRPRAGGDGARYRTSRPTTNLSGCCSHRGSGGCLHRRATMWWRREVGELIRARRRYLRGNRELARATHLAPPIRFPAIGAFLGH